MTKDEIQERGNLLFAGTKWEFKVEDLAAGNGYSLSVRRDVGEDQFVWASHAVVHDHAEECLDGIVAATQAWEVDHANG